jgi:putative FmdB family regulatory protein
LPIYEYKCEKCDHELEVIQKFSDEPVTVCPECNGKMSKKMSLSAFHLKGSGWYTTDYKKSSKSGEAPKASGEKQDGAEKADSKSEPKSESKSEAPKAESKSSSSDKGSE